MSRYDLYNREERAICAHLFRLLHEQLNQKDSSPLGKFLAKLSENNLDFRNGFSSLKNLTYENVAIYCEASLIRDAYVNRKPAVHDLMDRMTELIMKQEGVSNCQLYSELLEPLNLINETHPKQILHKAIALGIPLSSDESKVYRAMQSMFNAKPDLVITIDNLLLVCEAKHTEAFDEGQILRTENIAQIWSTLLYQELGFSNPPVYSVFRLGSSKFNPHISWQDVLKIAENVYEENDRTRIAIEAGTRLLV